MSTFAFQFVPEGIARGCRVWPSDWPAQPSITAGAGLLLKPLFLLTVIGGRTQAEVKLYAEQLLHSWWKKVELLLTLATCHVLHSQPPVEDHGGVVINV